MPFSSSRLCERRLEGNLSKDRVILSNLPSRSNNQCSELDSLPIRAICCTCKRAVVRMLVPFRGNDPDLLPQKHLTASIAQKVRNEHAKKQERLGQIFSKHVMSAYHNNPIGFKKHFGQNFCFPVLEFSAIPATKEAKENYSSKGRLPHSPVIQQNSDHLGMSRRPVET